VLEKAEDAGLVHLTSNVQNGHYFICNCCGCCCAILKGITKLGLRDVVNSDFYSEIDAELCNDCGMCAANVCQLDAISDGDGGHRVDGALCIGCGQCVRVCPIEAIRLLHKRVEERVTPPQDQDAWYDERGRARGVDFSAYR
jgi:Pyruvate/2-oxoacid:ferredoxin oxidoreductase delta subunit